jgi:hypothetical protein
MLPLAKIADEEGKIELTKEIIICIAKVMAVHNKRLGDEKVKKALKPIFDEKFMEGVTEGEARGAALSVQSVLNARFHAVQPKVQKQLSAMTDVSRLENLVGQAAVCRES